MPAPRRRRNIALRRRVVLAGGLVAVAAATAGVVVLAGGGPDERALVQRYARAWEQGDWAAMRAELTAGARRAWPLRAFATRYGDAANTATATRVTAGEPVKDAEGRWRLPIEVATRVFGPVAGELRLAVAREGDAARIDWHPNFVFPGLAPGARLTRDTRMPDRADLLARDGTPLAQGPGRTSPLGAVAQAIVGALGPIPDEERARDTALGYPADAQVGTSGLERIFDEQLSGSPGGELLAGARVIASRAPRKADAVRTTIAPGVQRAAVEALAGRLGGIVALRPATGEILAATGIGFSGLQPPGSTFKIITVTGAIEAGIVKPSDRFPVQTAATLSGVKLQNANGESCGGTLAAAFAESCNSVFAPLGARLGARRLVATAERFGFNRPTGIPGAATAMIPPAGQIGDDLAVGSSAIGQGRVQATALQMAIVAATIGLHGRRPGVTLRAGRDGRRAATARATTPTVAATVERLMLGVVRRGTGKAAAIPGVEVAGKTGTAELRSTPTCTPMPDQPETCPPEQPADTTDTDAWFAAFAPAGRGHPRIAVGILLVSAGAGGDTAAPAARQVLQAGLAR